MQLLLALLGAPLFREPPAGGPLPEGALSLLHVSDVHADPFYDVSLYSCGHKAATRNLSLQDARGEPTESLCGHAARPVAPACGPFHGDYVKMQSAWRRYIRPGPRCPCGVAFSNPPYSVIPPLRQALLDFSRDGYAARAVIYTGDLAGHYMPGTSVALENCTTAHAVVKSTIDELNVPDVRHFFVMGNNDVIPKNAPLTREWLEDLGEFLHDRDWLTEDELVSWRIGGFFWRMLSSTGLCAIGLNSNHWTPTQVNEEMREAQLRWLPDILGRKGETSVCTSGFLVASHIGVVCPGAAVHGGAVENKGLWDETKSSPEKCGEVRAILDQYEDAVVAELSGDLNKEFLYASGTKSYGFTVVGISQRAGNDPGFHRLLMTPDGSSIIELESYQMKRGCAFEFSHSFVEDYAPHFDGGLNASAVSSLLSDPSTERMRAANVAPNAAGITKKRALTNSYKKKVRSGEAGCLAASDDEVPRLTYLALVEEDDGFPLDEQADDEDTDTMGSEANPAYSDEYSFPLMMLPALPAVLFLMVMVSLSLVSRMERPSDRAIKKARASYSLTSDEEPCANEEEVTGYVPFVPR